MTIEPQAAPEPVAQGHTFQQQVDEAAAAIEAERAEPETEGEPSGDSEVDELDAFVEDPDIEMRTEGAEEEAPEIDLEDDQPDEAEDEEPEPEEALEAAEEEEQLEEAKRKARPGPKQRLQRKVTQLSEEVDRLRGRDFEWAKVSNALKGQRDFYKDKYQAAVDRLTDLGETEDSALQRRADAAELELRERDFDLQMDKARADVERDVRTKAARQKAVDDAIDMADKLSPKYDVDRDLLLIKWSEDPSRSMESVAEGLSARRKVKTSAKTKKQIAKNRKAPRMPAKGKSARPTRRPKVGDSESWVEAGMADVMGWRGK